MYLEMVAIYASAVAIAICLSEFLIAHTFSWEGLRKSSLPIEANGQARREASDTEVEEYFWKGKKHFSLGYKEDQERFLNLYGDELRKKRVDWNARNNRFRMIKTVLRSLGFRNRRFETEGLRLDRAERLYHRMKKKASSDVQDHGATM